MAEGGRTEMASPPSQTSLPAVAVAEEAPPSWGDIPDSILVRVSGFLPFRADRVHMACVNRQWQAAVMGLRRPPPPPRLPPVPPQLLWLLFPSTEAHTFYSALGRRYNRLTPDFRRARYCGGLLLALNSRHAHALYNLNSGTRIALPPEFVAPRGAVFPLGVRAATLLLALNSRLALSYLNCGQSIPLQLEFVTLKGAVFPLVVRAATLCPTPFCNHNMVAAGAAIVLVACRSTIAFWIVGRESWLSSGSLLGVKPQDVIFHGAGFFFFITPDEGVATFWPLESPDSDVMVTRLDYDTQQREDYDNDVGFIGGLGAMRRYLVESRGRLLMVVRYVNHETCTEMLRAPLTNVKPPRVTWEYLGDELDGPVLLLGAVCSRSFEVTQHDGFQDQESMIFFIDKNFWPSGHKSADVGLLCAINHPGYNICFMNGIMGDELPQRSDEWKELVKLHFDSTHFMRTVVCANYWPFTQAIALSNDNKPSHENENLRMQRAAGRLTRDKAAELTGGRFQWLLFAIHRTSGSLAVSRVIGEFTFKQNKDLPPEEELKLCDQKVIIHDIANDTEILVRGSGDTWDFTTRKGVVGLLWQRLRFDLTHEVVAKDLRDPSEVTCSFFFKNCRGEFAFAPLKGGDPFEKAFYLPKSPAILHEAQRKYGYVKRRKPTMSVWKFLLIVLVVCTFLATKAEAIGDICPKRSTIHLILPRTECPVIYTEPMYWMHAKAGRPIQDSRRSNFSLSDIFSINCSLLYEVLLVLGSVANGITVWEINPIRRIRFLLFDAKLLNIWMAYSLVSTLNYGSWVIYGYFLPSSKDEYGKHILATNAKGCALSLILFGIILWKHKRHVEVRRCIYCLLLLLCSVALLFGLLWTISKDYVFISGLIGWAAMVVMHTLKWATILKFKQATTILNTCSFLIIYWCIDLDNIWTFYGCAYVINLYFRALDISKSIYLLC